MRVPAKDLGRYPFYVRPFFWNQRRKYGQVLQAALLWARSPKLFMGLAALYGGIDRRSSPIDPALRSLVTVRVARSGEGDHSFRCMATTYSDRWRPVWRGCVRAPLDA